MMQQYQALKARAGDALLLFRLGDFYELFLRDAVLAAPLLGLVLTTRDRDVPDPVPMCGIPAHALEGYVRRLLLAGHAVAIAEQVEDPRQAKGLVRREIVEVATPGLVANAERLEGVGANFLAAVVSDGACTGLAFADVSTGEFAATESLDRAALRAELDRIAAREVVARDVDKDLVGDGRLRRADAADFDPTDVARRVGGLPAGLEASERGAGARAAAAIWATVAALQPASLARLAPLRRYSLADHLVLDAATRRHLEVFANLRDGSPRGTLFETVDRTVTALGRRMLARWLGEPLLDLEAIRSRHDRVAAWLEPDSRRRGLAAALRPVGDLERVYTRACLPAAGARELAQLRAALESSARVAELTALVAEADALAASLRAALVDDPPAAPRGEPHVGYVRDAVDADVDRIRAEGEEGARFLDGLEARERARTGIASLRVRYNRVFGYTIEVTRAQAARVPAEYERKQTTAGGERYTTAELRHWEGLVARLRERAAAAEAVVLERLRAAVRAAAERVRALAAELALLDVAQALATVAREHDWTRPELHAGLLLELEGSRHPVVERFVREFVPNDVRVDPEDAQLLILTGPNMAGKSTLLRQVALATLLAQSGSFVPARRARIGVADRIFTRVGASDSLITGESTFMLEMRETAAILREATPRSLVLLDEIGRGTSTFDGLSIAWAVAEHLHDAPGLRPRALFATHYHELADLAGTKPRVRNFHFPCSEAGGDLVFLRRMEPGAASRSYGIEVARLAGLPPRVIRRAREVLANLEGGEFDERGRPRLAREGKEAAPAQLGLFAPACDPALERLRALDVERMTPLEALVELDSLQRLARERA